MAETLEQRRDRLQALLDSGASSTTVDGQSTTFDVASIRRQLAAVQAAIAADAGDVPARPVAARIVLGHN